MTIENEHRFSVRRPRRHGAWITFDDDIRSFECQVLDISAGGAKLATNVKLPSEARLDFPLRRTRW